MQKFSQKYTIICLLEDKNEGYEFPSDNWPLHVTIADTFAIDWDIKKLIEELDLAARNHKTFESVALNDEYFGDIKQVHVMLIDKIPELDILHSDIVKMLKKGGLVFNAPQFSEAGFLPHYTIQKHAQVNIGDKIKFNNLALVDMFPNKDPFQRKIIKVFKTRS